MIGTLTTRTALGPNVSWRDVRGNRPSCHDIYGTYIREATTAAESVKRDAAIYQLKRTVDVLESESKDLKGLIEELDSQDKLDALLEALPDAFGKDSSRFQDALLQLRNPRPVGVARLSNGGLRDRCGRDTVSLALAVGEQVYVLPVWSCVHREVTIQDGHVWFAWVPCREGTQNEIDGRSHYYGVAFHPDGTVEEFRTTSSSGPNFKVIGGKLFSIRPSHWADPDVPTSDCVADKVVAVWDGVEGPQLDSISWVVESRGVPVYLGSKGRSSDWQVGTLHVVVRHPDQVIFEEYTGVHGIWCCFSKTSDAQPTRSTVYGAGGRVLKLFDGALVWGVKRDEVVTIYCDGHPITSGDFLAFYRHDDGAITVIERTPGDGRSFISL